MAKGNPNGNPFATGRKPAHPLLKANPVCLKFPQWLIDWLREQPQSQSKLIEEALCKVHKLKAPDVKKEKAV